MPERPEHPLERASEQASGPAAAAVNLAVTAAKPAAARGCGGLAWGLARSHARASELASERGHSGHACARVRLRRPGLGAPARTASERTRIARSSERASGPAVTAAKPAAARGCGGLSCALARSPDWPQDFARTTRNSFRTTPERSGLAPGLRPNDPD
eukprot:4734835-Pyramimonas_sp.AAC.1